MNTRDRILDVGLELVQTRGYSAFSYQDLSDRLGITKASIHHHFRTKQDLGQAVAEKYNTEVRAILDTAGARTDDPWQQLEGYVQMVLGIVKTRDRICAAGSVQSEFNVVPEAMRKSMGSLVQFVIGWLSKVIKRGRDLGVMDFPGSPDDQAALVFSAAQGAMQYGRANGANRARRVLQQMKASLMPRG